MQLLLFWSVVVKVDEVGMYYAVSVRSPFLLSSLIFFFFLNGAIFIHKNCQTL